jgi:hypothetical protein
MTPPRDEDATCDDFAPVIPLRRREHTLERPAAAEPSAPDFAVAEATAQTPGVDALPSVWQQPEATELLIRPATAADALYAGNREAATARRSLGSPHPMRRRLVQVAAASAVLAVTAAAVVAIAGDGHHPHPTNAAATLPTNVRGHTVATTPPVKTATHTRTRTAATKTPKRSPRVTRASGKRPVRHAAAASRPHRSSSVEPASAVLSSAPAVQATTSAEHTQAAAHQPVTPGGSAASPCVPGELGC